jgi:outer membrane biosynthesis protein TonB
MSIDAAATDRLPWLPDEPSPKPSKRRGNSLLAWGAAAVVLVGAGGFWFGARSVEQHPVSTARPVPTTTVPLPQAQPVETPQVHMPVQHEVRPAPAPQVRPTPEHEVRIAPPPARRAAAADAGKSAAAEAPAMEKLASPTANSPAPAAPASTQPFVMPKPWNPRVFSGAAGRVVQVGAFGSVRQAKRGWWFMVRAYPAMAHLPAVVRPTRNSKGRVFYRFQVGTTSQAHSEVLCQRMETIRLSCAVVGLPWKAKVER